MKKVLALVLALLCLCTLFAACKKIDQPMIKPDSPAADNGNKNNNNNTTPAPDASLEVRVWTLNGTTGFGMAQLIQQKKDGKAALNYNFTVETNAANVRDAVIAGTADIAAVPTNIASALYHAKGVKVLALNTAGVLYLVAKDDSVKTLDDLSGKTVYCPAQNPAFITNALIEKSKVTDITVDSTTYSDPTDLRTAVASGKVDYAILPEPMVTIAKSAAAKAGLTLTVALNLTTEWNKYFTEGSLVQGCVVVRSEFLAAHPNEVAKFMEEYKTSVEYVIANPAEAAEMIVAAGIFAQAPVAKNAIPKCNLCFITGTEMKTRLAAFLAAMPSKSIGGKLPGDDFYYGA